jgi:hypothetical protein
MGYEASFIESFYMMKIGLLFVVLTTFSVACGINEGEIKMQHVFGVL